MGYEATGLDGVGAVVQVGPGDSTADVSPSTKPPKLASSGGFAEPYGRLLSFAVMVSGARMMLKERATAAAGRNEPFPACDAVRVHVPTFPVVTVLPDTVQLPEALKVTGSPELAVALTVNGGVP